VITRIISNIGDEANGIRETGGPELYSLPFTPPEPLGGDNYNGKSVVYEIECPDGSRQVTDPCVYPPEEEEPPFEPTDYTFFRYRRGDTGSTTEWARTDATQGAAAIADGLGGAGLNPWLASGTVAPVAPVGGVGGALVSITYIDKDTGERIARALAIFKGSARRTQPFSFQGVWEFSDTAENDDIAATWGGLPLSIG
jgi:hypothetical protein